MHAAIFDFWETVFVDRMIFDSMRIKVEDYAS